MGSFRVYRKAWDWVSGLLGLAVSLLERFGAACFSRRLGFFRRSSWQAWQARSLCVGFRIFLLRA